MFGAHVIAAGTTKGLDIKIGREVIADTPQIRIFPCFAEEGGTDFTLDVLQVIYLARWPPITATRNQKP